MEDSPLMLCNNAMETGRGDFYKVCCPLWTDKCITKLYSDLIKLSTTHKMGYFVETD